MTLTDFTAAEQQAYENSLKYYRDLKNVTDTAFEEGKEEGKEEKAIEIARTALAEGASDAFVARITGLSVSQIENLRNTRQ